MVPRKPVSILAFFIALMAATAANASVAFAFTAEIQILSPGNNTWINASYDALAFSFTFSDPDNSSALCTLEVNSLSYGPALAIGGTQTDFFLTENPSQGKNSWNVTCVNDTAKTSAQMEFFYDTQAPVITLSSPAEGSTPGTLTMNATFSFTDGVSPDANCTLYANGSAIKVQPGVPGGTPSFLATSWTQNGTYAWNVSCTDRAANAGTSETRSIIVLLPPWPVIHSPANTTYDTEDIGINFSEYLTGDPYWMGYRLDGGDAVAISGNTTAEFSSGIHVLEITVNETAAASQKASVSFNVSIYNPITFTSPDDAFGVSWMLVNVSLSKDSEWCAASVDGGANFTMDKESARSWSYTFYTLSEGLRVFQVYCNFTGTMWKKSDSARVYSTFYTITIDSPVNITYWKTTSASVAVRTGRAARSCALRLDGTSELLMTNTSGTSWNYSLNGLEPGLHYVTVRCTDPTGLDNSTFTYFTVTTNECQDNVTGVCTGTQQCVNSMCSEIICTGCTYASGHACVAHECCDDSSCLESEWCSGNACTDVDCPCGAIKNHACIEYDCCSNFDCGEHEECDVDGHVCVKKTLILMAPQDMIAGEEVTISVVNHRNDGMEGVRIVIAYDDGEEETLTTGSDGTAKFTPSRTGPASITAEIEGYDGDVSSAQISPSLGWLLPLIAVLSVAGVGAYYYFFIMKAGGLSLSKEVAGQDVTLRVKNRGKVPLINVYITDAVPAGAFIGCSIQPGIEDVGGQTHLTWCASLEPGEEVSLTYKAAATFAGFSVIAGEKRYSGGGGSLGGILGRFGL